MNNLTAVDFFCGAGGFSEGFKQLGVQVIYGYDHWKPAIDTFNHNFNLNCQVKNILDYADSIEEIYKIPDTDIILGSPPCVSFSSSNKSGKADKSMGLKLTETFLRIVAVKKFQPNSKLKAWFMENVVNSRKFLKQTYSFSELSLTDWAIENNLNPYDIAINLIDNSTIINSADYGSIQARKRLISGEVIKEGRLIVPDNSHSDFKNQSTLPNYRTINSIFSNFPNPFESKSNRIVKDVNYEIEIKQEELTDHFYDTGIYEVEWRFSKFWKQNHPYMGKMSFPENMDKPSRTITATKIANSRESIIYKSEFSRKGDGEYRLPTVREAAIIMGFPITFQFKGAENNKWRLVGNAVCCAVSRSLAQTVLKAYSLEIPAKLIVNQIAKTEGVFNLNTYTKKEFNNPPVKNKGARFRRHPLKIGNLTVTLSNYDIEFSNLIQEKWFTSIQYGTGDGFPIQKIDDGFYKSLVPIIESFRGGKRFLDIINNGFTEKIGNKYQLQEMYEKQTSVDNLKEPTKLVDEIGEIIQKIGISDSEYEQNEVKVFENKCKVPIKQVLALYAINKISTIANGGLNGRAKKN